MKQTRLEATFTKITGNYLDFLILKFENAVVDLSIGRRLSCDDDQLQD